MKYVIKRITRDMDSGEVLETLENIQKIGDRSALYKEIPGAPRNIETTLVYTKFDDDSTQKADNAITAAAPKGEVGATFNGVPIVPIITKA